MIRLINTQYMTLVSRRPWIGSRGETAEATYIITRRNCVICPRGVCDTVRERFLAQK